MNITKKFDSVVHWNLFSSPDVPDTESFIVAVCGNRNGKHHAIHAIYNRKAGCFERKTQWYCSLLNLVKFNPVYANFELPLYIITAKEIEEGGLTDDRNS